MRLEQATASGKPSHGMCLCRRDPRWGRNQETNSEAPLQLGDYGKAYVEGMQLGEDPRFYKSIVTVSGRTEGARVRLRRWIAGEAL